MAGPIALTARDTHRPSDGPRRARFQFCWPLIAALLVAVGSVTGTGAAWATSSSPPPGDGTLVYSPSSSGGCSKGQIASAAEGTGQLATLQSDNSYARALTVGAPTQAGTSVGTPYYFVSICAGSDSIVQGFIGNSPTSNLTTVFSGGDYIPSLTDDGTNLYWGLEPSGDQTTTIDEAPVTEGGSAIGAVQALAQVNGQLGALAVNPATDELYYYLEGPNSFFELSTQPTSSPQQLSSPPPNTPVDAIAVDPVTNTEYWGSAHAGGDNPGYIGEISASGSAPTIWDNPAAGNWLTDLALDYLTGNLLYSVTVSASSTQQNAFYVSYGGVDDHPSSGFGSLWLSPANTMAIALAMPSGQAVAGVVRSGVQRDGQSLSLTVHCYIKPRTEFVGSHRTARLVTNSKTCRGKVTVVPGAPEGSRSASTHGRSADFSVGANHATMVHVPLGRLLAGGSGSAAVSVTTQANNGRNRRSVRTMTINLSTVAHSSSDP